MNNPIVWHEGMLLKPQHFQQFTKYLENIVHRRPGRFEQDLWGFSSLTIDLSALKIGKFALLSAEGILPNGSEFYLPERDPLPLPLTIKPEDINKTIVLAIPFYASYPKNINDRNNQHKYCIDQFDIADIYQSNPEFASIKIAKLNFQLFLKDHISEDWIILDIAKIKEVYTNGEIILDPNFSPSCLDISCSYYLKQVISDIYSKIVSKQAEINQKQSKSNYFNFIDEIRLFFIFQTIDRYKVLLNNFQLLKGIHPRMLYFLLIQMESDIRAFVNHHGLTDLASSAYDELVYNHANVSYCFKEIHHRILKNLSFDVQIRVELLKLVQTNTGLHTAKINKQKSTNSYYFILAAKSDLDRDKFHDYFSKQLKIAPLEQIEQLVIHALPGIPIQLLQFAPKEIPHQLDFTYYLISEQCAIELSKTASENIAIYVHGDFPNLVLELWIIRKP